MTPGIDMEKTWIGWYCLLLLAVLAIVGSVVAEKGIDRVVWATYGVAVALLLIKLRPDTKGK